MQMLRSKAKLAAAVVSVLLMVSVMLVAIPVQPVQAAEASWYTNQAISPPAGVTVNFTTDTKAYLNFRPNPIGVGQPLLINMWITPSVNTNRGIFNNKTGAYQIIITKPDGTKVTLVPVGYTRSELSAWMTYIPDVTGEYKIMFNFQGTYFPEQFYSWDNQYFKPSHSPEFTFTVQQEMVPSWPPAPLPSDYWTWPVDFSKREWYPILGTWPPTGYNYQSWGDYWDTLYPGTNPVYNSRHMFIPLVQGPNTQHVLRTSVDAIGGLYGGAAGITGQMADSGYPEVVYHGRCYDTVTRNTLQLVNGTYRYLPGSVAICYDLRTGEVYYEIPTAHGGVTPTMVMYDRGTSTLSDTPTFSVELQAISGGRLYKINPLTGAVTTNVSISPLPGTELMNQIDGYVVGIQNIGNATVPNYRFINWTTTGTTTNITARVVSNTTYARSSLPTLPTVDWESGYGAVISGLSVSGTGYATNVTAINAYTGATVWSTIYTGGIFYDPQSHICDHGKVSIWIRSGPSTGKQVTWDLATGKLLWESPTLDYPWAEAGFSVYGAASAYGLLFRPAYDGLYAISWDTGEVVWKCPRYARAHFESPYTEFAGGQEVYPGQTQVRIADGKVYIYDGEHSPQQPRVRGWSLYCINATTGKVIWNFAVTGGISFSTPPSTGPIIDGYLYFPATTGTTYIIGKGKSATTVTAPDVAVPKGTSVLIKGTVLDQSPAQPGTPCVSKDSMRTQMEYLHLAYPIDGLWNNETITGVPVTLGAIGPDGNYIDIGTATTNGYSGVFSQPWTPPAEGKYEIIASFAADDSYGSSSATTAVLVGPAPEPYPSPIQPEAPVDYTPTLYGILAAVIVAIVIGIVAVLLALRKRP